MAEKRSTAGLDLTVFRKPTKRKLKVSVNSGF